jgi:hypothetical protein
LKNFLSASSRGYTLNKKDKKINIFYINNIGKINDDKEDKFLED